MADIGIERIIGTVVGEFLEFGSNKAIYDKIRIKDIRYLLSKIRRKICSSTVSLFIAGLTSLSTVAS
jgi:hypothetical protein